MSKKTIAIVAATLSCLAAATPQSAVAAPLVQVCAPPGGVWGPGNTFRSKIEKYADNTIVYMSQNFATPDTNRWFRTPPMPLAGGPFTNGMGGQSSVAAEGDGYKLTAPGPRNTIYNAHFACVAAR